MLLSMLPLAVVAALQVRVQAGVQRRPVPDSAKARAAADSAKQGEHAVVFGVQIGGSNADDETERAAPRRIPVTDALRRSAFKDTTARTLLLRARAARLRQDSLLVSYDARAYQRFSIGMNLRTLGRDRLLLRHEDVSHVRWHRARGVWVDVAGSRTVAPAAAKGDAPDNVDMASDPPIPYFPGREELWIGSGLAKSEVDERDLVHPIAEGSEAYYRYETGDSVIMTLPDQSRITLREIRVEAREPKWNLTVGSFWFDQATARPVRAVYRLSVPIDIWAMNSVRRDARDVPFWVKPMISPLKANVDAISIEYGLYNGRFWLPKLQVLEAGAQVGMIRVPVQVEQHFRYAAVNGLDSLPAFPRPVVSYATVRDSLRRAGVDSVTRDSVMRRFRRQRDSLAKPLREQECARGPTYTRMQTRYNGAVTMALRIPCDSAKLSQSPELVGSLMEPGESVFGTNEIDELKKALDFSLQAGWAPQKPVVSWGLPLTRYNRVEGLSSGLQASMTLGRGYAAIASLRASLADKQLNGELSLERSNGRATVRGGVFRRLAVANDFSAPLSFGSGIGALLYAGDETFYYRTWGAELTGTVPRFGRTEWRLFAEQQWNAPVATTFTLLRGAHDDRVLPNIVGDYATELGGAVRVQKGWGFDPRRFRVNADLRAEAAGGDFAYARGLADVTASHGLPRGTEIAVTASAGSSAGTLPTQRQFQLGGLQTVRGIRAGTMSGTAFWMVRGEFALASGAIKPVVFGDVGWAGDRQKFSSTGRPMSGAGAGLSVLDGLVRLDVARGIFPQKKIRVDLSVEARF